jgi:hypothetical protein
MRRHSCLRITQVEKHIGVPVLYLAAAAVPAGSLHIGLFDRSYDPANHMYGYTLADETSPGTLNFALHAQAARRPQPPCTSCQTSGRRWRWTGPPDCCGRAACSACAAWLLSSPHRRRTRCRAPASISPAWLLSRPGREV